MDNLLLFILVTLALFVSQTESNDADINDLSRGFGSGIHWLDFDKGMYFASKYKKPVFLLIHKTWCGACSSLKTAFNQKSAQKQLIPLSKHFIMINVEDDEEPEDERYSPDGNYIPRLLFLEPDGSVMNVVNPKAKDKNLYYYSSPAPIIESMKKVMKMKGIEDDSGSCGSI